MKFFQLMFQVFAWVLAFILAVFILHGLFTTQEADAGEFSPRIVHQVGTPDRRGEDVQEKPSYRGVNANAPIPPKFHVRNEGGSDGQGLCVISSILVNGQYQGVPGLNVPDAEGRAGKGSRLWRTAKSRPGGYGPDKLQRLVDQVMPGEKWASYVGRDTDVLDKLSAKGYPIGATMNTGQLYRYMPIHHMISLVHYSKRDNLACVVDNNRPGFYSWMPRAEFDRRWFDGGTGWAWIWTRLPQFVRDKKSLAHVLLILAAAFVAVGVLRRTDERVAA